MVRWHLSADAFKPEETLSAVAESLGYQVKSRTGQKSGRVTLTVDTRASAGRRGKLRLVSPEAAKTVTQMLRRAMRDPDKAPQIAALVARSKAGEDVGDELLNIVGPDTSAPRAN